MTRAWVRLALAAALATVTFALPGSAHAAGETIRVEDATAWNEPLLDPVQYSGQGQQIFYLTCARLYNYADLPGALGLVLQPEVADGFPTVSPDGLTYTFTLKSGFGFSPPSTEQVTADSFVRAIARAESPAGGGLPYPSIASAVASGGQLVITLNAPAPSLVETLAESLFCAVPSDTPLDGFAPATTPSAGPYYVASAPAGEFVLKQNPNYGGSRIRNLGEIDWFYGVGRDQAISDVESGVADYATNLNGADHSALSAAYGPGSQAAVDGHQQYFANALAGTWFLDLNTQHGLLADPRLRQAISYAIDRTAIASLATLASPTDQYLPPGFPGFANASIYPFTSDLAMATSLAAAAGVSTSHPVTLVTYIQSAHGGSIDYDALVPLLQSELAPIGVNLDVRRVTPNTLFGSILPDPTAFDVAFFGWLADYADPFNFLNLLFDSALPGNVDWSYYSGFNSSLEAAGAMLPGPDRDAAYAQLDRDIAAQAPMVPVFNGGHDDLFSARIGCQVYQPFYGMNLNELCVRLAAPEPAGGTLSTGTVASTDAPLQTAVTTPNAGQVSIQQGVATDTVTNYQLLQQQLTISAPNATAAVPLQLTFTLDSSLVGATDPSTIDAIRDGTPVPPCSDSSGQANPDPCLASRTTLAGGDLQLVVLSSHASLWNFGIRLNRAPVCTAATTSPSTLWPVNGRFVPVTITGVTDPDGDPVTVSVTSVSQNEAGSGDSVITATGASLRATRLGSGSGRIYTLAFSASDGRGGTCTGSVAVTVPHDQGH